MGEIRWWWRRFVEQIGGHSSTIIGIGLGLLIALGLVFGGCLWKRLTSLQFSEVLYAALGLTVVVIRVFAIGRMFRRAVA